MRVSEELFVKDKVFISSIFRSDSVIQDVILD